MATVKKSVCVLLLITGMASATQRSTMSSGANPIRKVVNLLQAMQKKVTEEGARADHLYEKFMCYCETGGKDLAASIAAAEAKGPDLASQIEAASSRKVQLEEDLKVHQKDRAAAKDNIAEATAIREKEKAAYDKELADSTANLAALHKAVAAISEGMGGAFLQTQAAGILRSLLESKQDMSSGDRQEVMSFLSEKNQYAPSSGEILGILKQMRHEMQASQDDLIATEVAAVKAFRDLRMAKQKEVAALSMSIEQKLGRVGELGVKIAALKNDAEDTAEALTADRKFLAGLNKNCAGKNKVHELEKKQRAAEIVALADTIKILNDDDALDLFKKTLPSAGSSLIQLHETSAARVSKVREVLAGAKARAASGSSRHHLDFILLALRGHKVGFAKIVKLIDDLVVTLKKEQVDDSAKKEYCATQFDQIDDKKKGLERSLSDLGTVIEESEEGIATLTEEINALKAGIVALDRSVAEATEQRHAESAEFKDLIANNGAAKELILFAKNRLQKFYNPKLHKAPAERELSEEDRIYENEGGEIPTEAPGGIANTGIHAFIQMAATHRAAPGLPPATAAAYTKSKEHGGVISLLDLLVSDLDAEMTEAKEEEKNAQQEYKEMLADSADKRRQDAKSLTEKEAARADLQGSVEESVAEKKATTKELMATERYLAELHADCDWLVKYFDVRQTARSDEIDSLEKAKAVLAGADYSLLQHERSARTHKFLQRV